LEKSLSVFKKQLLKKLKKNLLSMIKYTYCVSLKPRNKLCFQAAKRLFTLAGIFKSVFAPAKMFVLAVPWLNTIRYKLIF